MHRAVVLADGPIIERQHLPEELAGNNYAMDSVIWGPDASLTEVESLWISHMLLRCEGNKSEAARRLGIDVSTLHRKLRDAR